MKHATIEEFKLAKEKAEREIAEILEKLDSDYSCRINLTTKNIGITSIGIKERQISYIVELYGII